VETLTDVTRHAADLELERQQLSGLSSHRRGS
jgi:hypothetical protein